MLLRVGENPWPPPTVTGELQTPTMIDLLEVVIETLGVMITAVEQAEAVVEVVVEAALLPLMAAVEVVVLLKVEAKAASSVDRRVISQENAPINRALEAEEVLQAAAEPASSATKKATWLESAPMPTTMRAVVEAAEVVGEAENALVAALLAIDVTKRDTCLAIARMSKVTVGTGAATNVRDVMMVAPTEEEAMTTTTSMEVTVSRDGVSPITLAALPAGAHGTLNQVTLLQATLGVLPMTLSNSSSHLPGVTSRMTRRTSTKLQAGETKTSLPQEVPAGEKFLSLYSLQLCENDMSQ